MPGEIYLIFIIGLILFTLVQIAIDRSKKKKRKHKVLSKLNRGTYNPHLAFTIIWFAIFFMSAFSLVNEVKELYQLLGKEYISSVGQSLSVHYLENLREYFYENSMLIKFHEVTHYQRQLPSMLTWAIGSFCVSVWNLYQLWQDSEILEDGLFFSGQHIGWDEIIKYKWNKKKRPMSKESKYYSLLIEYKKSKAGRIANLFRSNVNNEVTFKVECLAKDYVDSLLEKYGLESPKQ